MLIKLENGVISIVKRYFFDRITDTSTTVLTGFNFFLENFGDLFYVLERTTRTIFQWLLRGITKHFPLKDLNIPKNAYFLNFHQIKNGNMNPDAKMEAGQCASQSFEPRLLTFTRKGHRLSVTKLVTKSSVSFMNTSF